MPHDHSPARGVGSSQIIGPDSSSTRAVIVSKIERGLTEFNGIYPDAHLQLIAQNPADVDSNYFIFRLSFQTLHRVSELEVYLGHYLEELDYAIRLVREQLVGEGRVVVFIDVHKGVYKKHAEKSGTSFFWYWGVVLTILAFIVYSLRQTSIYSWE
jgi:hypothetical protein